MFKTFVSLLSGQASYIELHTTLHLEQSLPVLLWEPQDHANMG